MSKGKSKRAGKPWLIKGWLISKLNMSGKKTDRNAWMIPDNELAAIAGITDGVQSQAIAKRAIDAVWLAENKSRSTIFPTDRFYSCREWKELRYKAIVTYGNKCQCCGCGPEDGVKIHVDHIKPRSTHRHLQLEFSNLQILCDPCNIGKSNIDSTDWRERMDAESLNHLRLIK